MTGVARAVDLAEKLCWVCISTQPSPSSSSSTEQQQTKQYFWPCLLFPDIDYDYYCCPGRKDATNNAASKKEALNLASKMLEKMADELMVPASQNDEEEAGAADMATSPTSPQTSVRIAKMLGRGLDDYLEIVLDDVKECVTDFSSHLMRHVKAQANPKAFFGSDHDFEDEECAALYVDFMKSVDEAQYILKTGVHPTVETGSTTGPFHRKAEQTLKVFHDKKKEIVSGEQSKPAATQSRRRSPFPTATDASFASKSEASNEMVAAPAAAESFTKAANQQDDPMDTDVEAVAAEDERSTKSDESTVYNIEPGIEVTDTFNEAVRKLELAGWNEMLVRTPHKMNRKRVYVRPGTSDYFQKKDLEKHLRETYGWGDKQKGNIPTTRTLPSRPGKKTAPQTKIADKKTTKKSAPKAVTQTKSGNKKTTKKTSTKKTTTKKASGGSSVTPKKVTVTKKKKESKHGKKLSPRKIDFATPVTELKQKAKSSEKKDKQVGRRSSRARVPPGILLESAGGRTPSGSDYVKQSFERRQNELKKFSSDDEAEFYNFRNLWRKLDHNLGWRYGSHPLEDHVYYKPGSSHFKEGGKYMVDYFHREKEVVEFCIEQNYYGRRAELRLTSSSSSSSSSTPTKKKRAQYCTP
eukprot:CAMPEP_0113509286 /NCGR_PEP_ID=MMETSP0014_2-20120614/37486_1 /TAXON_ID=2857 /ORGANISM="Nitzschia sp." /LENGTH=636 /DNA_ID=CAMNT_0000405089 /DNA_START=37 /DNA_END=1947 /DNA_ORIENTATION=- /assembly_acc=CAM_ASM_000159